MTLFSYQCRIWCGDINVRKKSQPMNAYLVPIFLHHYSIVCWTDKSPRDNSGENIAKNESKGMTDNQ